MPSTPAENDNVSGFETEFRKKIESNEIFEVNGCPVNSSMFFNLMFEYMNSLNDKQNPCITMSFERVRAGEARRVQDELINLYISKCEHEFNEENLPMDHDVLLNTHRSIVEEINLKLEERLAHLLDVERMAVTKLEMIRAYDDQLKTYESNNDEQSKNVCESLARKILDDLVIPETFKEQKDYTEGTIAEFFEHINVYRMNYDQHAKGKSKLEILANEIFPASLDVSKKFAVSIEKSLRQEITKQHQEIVSLQSSREKLSHQVKDLDGKVLILSKEKDQLRMEFEINEKDRARMSTQKEQLLTLRNQRLEEKVVKKKAKVKQLKEVSFASCLAERCLGESETDRRCTESRGGVRTVEEEIGIVG
jgi:hypothetical protein